MISHRSVVPRSISLPFRALLMSILVLLQTHAKGVTNRLRAERAVHLIEDVTGCQKWLGELRRRSLPLQKIAKNRASQPPCRTHPAPPTSCTLGPWRILRRFAISRRVPGARPLGVATSRVSHLGPGRQIRSFAGSLLHSPSQTVSQIQPQSPGLHTRSPPPPILQAWRCAARSGTGPVAPTGPSSPCSLVPHLHLCWSRLTARRAVICDPVPGSSSAHPDHRPQVPSSRQSRPTSHTLRPFRFPPASPPLSHTSECSHMLTSRYNTRGPPNTARYKDVGRAPSWWRRLLARDSTDKRNSHGWSRSTSGRQDAFPRRQFSSIAQCLRTGRSRGTPPQYQDSLSVLGVPFARCWPRFSQCVHFLPEGSEPHTAQENQGVGSQAASR